MSKKRVAVYIDGFNLYHAIDDLGENHLKWVDLWQLSEKLIRADETIEIVKYFSAYAKWRPTSYRRHQRYVAVLETVGVTPVMGRFKAKTVRCKASCKEEYSTHEEKETDVNIGVHLMADVLRDRFDRALIISADTDLTAAVALSRAESKTKLIDIVAPPKRKQRNSAALFEITIGKVRASLLPEEVQISSTKTITRPPKYNPPES